jgi:hypothetical protein
MAAAAAPAYIRNRNDELRCNDGIWSGRTGIMSKAGSGRQPPHNGRDGAIDDFIRRNGVTRCPTACVVPTQGEVAASDRAALAEYATGKERSRQARAVRRTNPFWVVEPRRPDRR